MVMMMFIIIITIETEWLKLEPDLPKNNKFCWFFYVNCEKKQWLLEYD
jgi:hypothetical protein